MSRTGNVDRRTTLKLLGMGGAGLAAPYIIRSQPAWAASGCDVATILRANTGSRVEGYGLVQSLKCMVAASAARPRQG